MSSRSTQLISPAKRTVLSSQVASRGPMLRFGFLLTGALVLLVVTFVLYPLTEDGSFYRELVVAGLGAVITVIAAVLAAWGPLSELRKARREAHLQAKLDSGTWALSAIELGRLRIPDIVVVASAGKDTEWTDGVDLEFEESAAPRVEPEEMASLREHRLPEQLANAARRGTTLVDDPCVDLVAASRYFVTAGDGVRRTVYSLTPAAATYFDFAITTANLRAPLPPAMQLGAKTLEEHWQVRPRTIEDVSGLPAMAKVGVATVVVTSDDRLVLGLRGKTYIAGSSPGATKAPVHVVAEGMIPTDVDRRGRLHPAVTARRGLSEELHLKDDDAYGRVEELRAVGFFFDQSRWQPCFAYLARIDLTWAELQTLAPMASSYWEVERLISMPFSIDSGEALALLLGKHPQFELASNHAAAAIYFALLYHHGLFKMRQELLIRPVAAPAGRQSAS